jgi:WASH complex subunit CCDC53
MGESSIDTKKTIAMINAFSVATGEFLNHFCAKAHKKISQVNRQIERLEGLTALLEHKVNSFPADLNPPPPAAAPQVNPGDPTATTVAEPEPPKSEIDECYLPYIRMLKVRVPRQAVKLKMRADGFDPDILDQLKPPTDDE